MVHNMKKTVLIIDDENDLCELISMVLEREGFLVDCACNLAEAMFKLNVHPDIVLLDNNLPDGTGLDFLQMHPVDFMGSHVVLISADPSMELRERAAVEGIQDFLAKPFSMFKMKEIIKRVA